MEIAIHNRQGSYSDRWIERCRDLGVQHRVIDCHASNVMSQLSGVGALLWHWDHLSARDVIAARAIIAACENAGVRAYPNTATCWHFDDKLAQKYLLEAIGAPTPETMVFFDEDSAREWIGQATFPRVFKLRRGAGSSNVRLVKSRSQARSLARQAFSGGFRPVQSYFSDLGTRVAKARKRRTMWEAIMRVPDTVRRIRETRRSLGRDRGYLLLQEFLPGNTHDTRVTIIGDRAFGFTRGVRPGEFRASGSGRIDHSPDGVDRRTLELSFRIAERLRAQSVAFDFMTDERDHLKVIEISYAFQAKAVFDCPGYWDRNLAWCEGHVWPQDAILEDILAGS